MNRAAKRHQKKLARQVAKNRRGQSPKPLGQSLGGAPASHVSELVQKGSRLHQTGQVQEAETIYRQVLEIDPDHADANHLLGILHYQAGSHAQAVELISRAIATAPNQPGYYSNLGIALKDLGKLDEAVASFQKAIDIKPDYAEAHGNLGNAFKDLGNLDEAVASYRKALAIKPDFAEAHSNLGNAFQDLGKLDEAVASFRKALAIKPDLARAHYNLGNALQVLERFDEAVASYHKALAVKPDYAEAHGNLGNAFKSLERLDDAMAAYRKALAIEPNYADAHNNLGTALEGLGRLDESVASYREALAIQPDYAEAHYNLGNALKHRGQLEEAVACYHEALATGSDTAEVHSNLGDAFRGLGRLDEAVASCHRALAIKPELVEANNNLGHLQLLAGDFQDGWKNYAWRWRMRDAGLRARDYQQPFWDGGALDGKTIFIYPEQGLGDTIQFARYVPLVEALGARVVFEVPEPLSRLFKGGGIAANVVGTNENPPPFDCHASLLDLPPLMNTTLETIPDCNSVLSAPPELHEAWAERIRPDKNIRLGIVWAGNPKHKNDRNRSIEGALFRPLTEMPGVSVYSLQVGRDGEAARLFDDKATDIAPCLTDFAETAAAIGHLDLIVSADTSVAHLAGTLGKPVWTLLPFAPDWRWLLERDDSPWYPTMRLFRQTTIGDWAGVVERIGKALYDRTKPNR